VTDDPSRDWQSIGWWRLATRRKVMVAVRRVLREARAGGLLSHEDYLQAIDVKRLPMGWTRKAGRDPTEKELVRIFAAIGEQKSPIKERDAALLGSAGRVRTAACRGGRAGRGRLRPGGWAAGRSWEG